MQVVPEIRAKVSFAEHDLLCLTPPREDFSLIVCKNVLLHFDEAQRRQVFRMFHRALRPGGLLATEHTQKLPGELDALFEPAASYAQIFRRVDATESVHKHIDGRTSISTRRTATLFKPMRGRLTYSFFSHPNRTRRMTHVYQQ